MTFDNDTDLLPYISRMSWSFGRLMPIGVTGPESPASTITSIARAVTPVTLGLRYCGSHGMRSSNHCAWSAMRCTASVFSRIDVVDQSLPRALHAARVHVDLDEAVDRVERRLAILDPRDVVGAPILGVAGPIEARPAPRAPAPSTASRTGCAASRCSTIRAIGFAVAAADRDRPLRQQRAVALDEREFSG